MDDFNFFTIICIVVAVLVLWQLWRVLGTKSGYQGPPRGMTAHRFNKKPDEAGQAGTADQAEKASAKSRDLDQKEVWDEIDVVAADNSQINGVLRSIYDKDKSFSPTRFATKAQAAYEMILTTFFSGDLEEIKPLVTAELYDDFCQEVQLRQQNGERIEFSFIGVKEFKYLDAQLDANVAKLSIQLVSEIVFALYDGSGKLLEGDPKKVTYNNDIWHFERDLTSDEPTWILVKTHELN